MRVAACALLAATLLAPTAMAQQKLIAIGTSGVSGVYYAAGTAACRLVNRDRVKHGIRCTVESTGGSLANIDALRAGQLEIALVQSDAQFNAVKGRGPFREAGPYDHLRAVLSLHVEPFTVVVRKETGARTLADLKGRKFNVGNPGSGARASMEELLDAMGWKLADFNPPTELKADEHGEALCQGRIDGFFYGVGHPSANIQEPVSACGAKLVPLEGAAVDRLVSERPYYVKALIPGGYYAGNPSDIRTYGVMATMVTSSKVPEEYVYTVVKAIFENLDEFRRLHPALAKLQPGEMTRDGLSAPLHEGALRYYRERGWIR